jgi:2,4-dienoyl-CoA reductase (NADPH2)
MAGHYNALAAPLDVGPVTLRNRIVMGSMHTGLEGARDDAAHDRLARFYAERAKGGAALIVTGGFGPNIAGRLAAEDQPFSTVEQARQHARIARAVHDEGAAIVLQLVHAGRYGYHEDAVAPSPIRSPINRAAPREMTEAEIAETIEDYVRGARLAKEAGYDGVEIMGSEGYLISQFLAPRTNKRTDAWGGPLEARARFPLAVVSAVRAALGAGFLIVYRHSVLDLVEDALSWDETVWVGREVARAGANIINTGIGWHEAKIPTIAGVVPHAAFVGAIGKLKRALPIPVAASNRINTPEVAERILAAGDADLVSLARPLLADAAFASKAFAGKAREINVCIACNQACLDHYFESKVISCLVNPRAGYEAEYEPAPLAQKKRIAVIGAGMAGMAAAIEAARRGHHVEIFEQAAEAGGQMNLAARVPGKADYRAAAEAYVAQLRALGVPLRLSTHADPALLARGGFDAFVIATGVRPRELDIPGSSDPRVITYEAALTGAAPIGPRVAIIGAGGIGHDVALTLASPNHAATSDAAAFARRWGVAGTAEVPAPVRQVTLMKRQPGPFGRTLGKTTGWIVRQELRDLRVAQLAGVTYLKIDAAGLHIEHDGARRIIEVDTIVSCAGQEPENELAVELAALAKPVHLIGGARHAAELDAKRAVDEGVRLGLTI